MTFRNPILGAGGSTLLRPAIQSPNYSPGSTGWKVGRDGSAEFNNLTLRGVFVGANYVQNANGEFFYSAAPAAGNLVGSIAPTAGTDAYGNAYPAGFTQYDRANGLFVNLQNGIVRCGALVSGAADLSHAGSMQGQFPVNGPANTNVSAPTTATNATAAQVVVNAGVFGSATGAAGVPFVQFVADGSTACDMGVNGSIVRIDPNSGVQFTPLQWQTPSLGSGWATGPSGGTVQPLQYRLDPMDNLVIDGCAHTTTTTPATTIFTLPTGYRPKVTRRSPGVSNSGGTATARYAEVSSNGNVSINAAITTASTDVYFEVTIPLGNIK